MHIDVTGRGPDLVLIHGWALQGGVFAPLVQRLADQFTLHLVDLPGHGHSRDDTTPLRLPFVVSAIAAATPRRCGAAGRWVACSHCMRRPRCRRSAASR